MKFKDIIEDRRLKSEPYSEKELDLINRCNKWTNKTDFRLNDPEGYEILKEYPNLGKTVISNEWAKIPKTQEELIRIAKTYKNVRDFRKNDNQSAKLIDKDKKLWGELLIYWNKKHYDNMLEDFIEKSKKKYRMFDQNNPDDLTKTIPRFNYNKLKEIGLDFSTPKHITIPIDSIYCNLHKIDFPKDIPVRLSNHLSEKTQESGCPLCRKDHQTTHAQLRKPKFTKEEWVESFKNNTANQYPSTSKYFGESKYDYTDSWLSYKIFGDTNKETTYINDIKCKIHDYVFAKNGIRASKHNKGGSGCPKCNGSESIGEDRLNGILINIFGKENVNRQEKDISGLTFKNNTPLRFDRYVKIGDKEIYFEFDGIQHFYFTEYFQKNIVAFYESVARDIVKNNYCKQNNIKLIRIGYIDSNNMEDEIKIALENSTQMVLSSRYPELGWNTPDMEKNDPYLYRYLKQFKVLGEGDLKLMNLI